MRVRERLKLKERQRKKEEQWVLFCLNVENCLFYNVSEEKVPSSSTLAALSFVFLLTRLFFKVGLVG